MRETKGLKAAIVAAVAIIAVIAGTIIAKNIKNANLSPEMKRTMQYETFSSDFDKVDNCDYVRFGAYFAQDLDGDGYAEKIAGSCKSVKSSNTMFIDLSVVQNGYLEDGKITINGTNMKYAMQVVQDSMLDGNYISNNVREIRFRNVNAGNNEFLSGVINPTITTENDYSKPLTVTLTGTHVSDPDPDNNGQVTRTPISKTITLTVDWYGESYASANGEYKKLYLEDYCKPYIERVGEYDPTVERPVTFSITTKDTKKELLTVSNVITVEIPQIYGYYPTSVTAPNGVYDSNTHILTITKNNPAYTDTVEVSCVYPQEAYNLLEPGDCFSAPVTSTYTCHNNPNEEFDNPYVSNTATAVANFYFEIYTPALDEWGIRITTQILDKVKMDNDYFITKQNLIDAYLLENDEDIRNVEYKVEWNLTLKTHNEPHDYDIYASDEHSSGDLINGQPMNNYINHTGIYFRGSSLVPNDAVLQIYNDDTNELVKEFTYSEILTYTETNPYYYDTPVSRVRAEIHSSNYAVDREYKLDIITIREIDSRAVKADFTKDEAVDFGELHTRCKAYISADGYDSAAMVDDDSARLETERNYVELSVYTDSINTTEITPVNKTISIYIPKAKSGIYRDWVDGQFLIKVPRKIKYFKIKNVTSTNNDVQIDGYDLYVFHGNYFIEVLTSNTEPTSGIRINIDCEMLADPMTSADTVDFELYAFNEDFNIYYNSAPDIYDVNGDEDTTELIGYDTAAMQIFVPTSFSTVQTISNYNQDGDVTIAPNIAEVTTARRTATMNVQFINNYGTPVDNIRILGKVPSEGNTYVGGGTLNSEFDVYMTNDGITVPSNLASYAHVYYSEVEDPTEELDVVANGWKEAAQTNFANVKSYLIVLENYTAESGVPYTFSYDVSIPSGVDVNAVTYGCHKMFFDLYLDGESGKLEREINPNKVGLRVSSYYDLDITKLKEGLSRGVQGAKYKIEEINDVATVNELNKVLTSTNGGHITLSDLRVNQLYRFYEIKAPDAYELNNDVIEFKVVPGANDTLSIVYESQATFGQSAAITTQGGVNTLTANIYDTPKAKVTLNKIDADTSDPLDDVRFVIDGKLYTTQNGVITVDGFSLNHEYSVSEVYANGYYLAADFTFTVNKANDGTLSITSTNSAFASATITNDNNDDYVNLNVTFPNYKIDTYDLVVKKVSETKAANGDYIYLQNAKFLLIKDDLNTAEYITTNGSGEATAEDLYLYEAGRDITGRYVLVEDEAPTGYVNNREEIAFVVTKTMDGQNRVLSIDVENENSLETLVNSEIDQVNKVVTMYIQDKPLFKVTKKDADTNELLQNVGFVIYELDENGQIVDYAKDPNGEYIGTRDSQGRYLVYTDANGEITAPLKNGVYKIIEVEFLEGYKEVDNSEIFRVYSKEFEDHYQDVEFPEVDLTEPTREINNTITINYIEDWVTVAQDVNSGTDYTNTKVLLGRTLDFNLDSSYSNPTGNDFGDVNGDGTTGATLKEELTDANGYGCIPLGTKVDSTTTAFKGVFDGQGYQLNNFYSNRQSSQRGVFGAIDGAIIKNITITGTDTYGFYGGCIGTTFGNASYIKNVHTNMNIATRYSNNQSGGIVSVTTGPTTIVDCTNRTNFTNSWNDIGGIVGRAEAKTIIANCVNYGDFNCPNGYHTAGILGNNNHSETVIINCHNEGNITADNDNAGIVGYAYAPIKIKNCYNTGTITGRDGLGGIGADCQGALIVDCYNTGAIFTNNTSAYVGGVVGQCNNAVTNCYNKGNITSTYSNGYVGGVLGYGSANVLNCHNEGNITSKDYQIGGVVGYGSGGIMKYCYNTGKITNNGGSGSYCCGLSSTVRGGIEDCFNLGDIEVSGSAATYAAGIAYIYSSYGVKNCYNAGNIDMSSTHGTLYVVGVSPTTCENCYNKGDIYVHDSTYAAYVSGLGRDNCKNCYNSGDITVKNVPYGRVGGISADGSAYTYENCYNTGNITFEPSATTSNSTIQIDVGGISATANYGQKFLCSYNTGDIKVKIPDYSSGVTKIQLNVGGICSYTTGTLWSTTYNMGEIKNCYNTGNIDIQDNNDIEHLTYVGGILGQGLNKSTNVAYKDLPMVEIDGVYNTGNIFNRTLYNENGIVKTGAIYGDITGTVDNAYYLNSAIITAKEVENQSQYAISSSNLKSDEIFESLGGSENKWIKFIDSYPTLDIDDTSNSQILSEITFFNQKETYDITTEIGYNISGLRSGGTITGTYNDKYVNGGAVKFVENLTYGEDATQNIVITPDAGYEISSLTINGFDEPFIAEQDGSYTIPASRFTEVNQNYHVIVVFTEKSNILTINKVDEQGEPLEGVEFSIDQIEDRAAIGSEYGSKTGDASVQAPNFNSEVTGIVGNVTAETAYGFVEDNGKYISTNVSQNGTEAEGYVELDLTGMTGKFQIRVNAESTGGGTGYIAVTDNTDLINTTGFATLSGTKAAQDYDSAWIDGGSKYYIHFRYLHSLTSSNDNSKMTINNITLYARNDITLPAQTYPITLNTDGSNGYDSYNSTYITLPLAGETGDYNVEVDAQIRGGSYYYSYYSRYYYYYGFGVITPSSTTTCPQYNYTDGNNTRNVFNSKNNESRRIYLYNNLPGGSDYKLWLASFRQWYYPSTSYGLTVYDVKVYQKIETPIVLGNIVNNSLRQTFIDDNGVIKAQDNRITNVAASAYVPIDLSGYTGGKYKVVVDADINDPSSSVYSYATLTTSTDLIGMDTEAGRMIYRQGSINTSGEYISDEIDGGSVYYLHLGQFKQYNSTDSFNINSIKVYESQNQTIGFTESINDGVRSYVSNNQRIANTTAKACIPIDLSNTRGKYNLKINAEISSETNDHGYIFVTESSEAPATTAQDGKLVDLSGEVAAAEYHKILNAGKVYYVHLLYNKDVSVNGGTDTFKINSLVLDYNTDDFFHEKNILTDSNGKITRAVGVGKYEIKETKALDDYEPVESVIHEITLNSDNDITITNYHNKTITTHYLENGTGPEFGTEAHVLAPEEVQTLNHGDSYTTTPLLRIDGYKLHEENDEYVIPSNASGTVGDSDIDVYYYYDLIKYDYVINYYYDGVKDDDKTETGSEVPGTVITYEDKLVEGYIFDRSVNAPMEISEYEEENVIDVYYATILHITTDVVEHTEYYADGTSASGVKGGSISGEDEDPYETVQIGFANTKSIVIEPNSGYEIENISVNGTAFDYSELIENGIVTIPEYYFKEMSEGKHITVSFKKITDVRVRYLVTESETALRDDIIINGYAGDEYTTESKSFLGYKPASPAITDASGTQISANGTMTADEYTVIYWYDIDNSTILEKHILLEENNAETVIESETHTGQVGTSVSMSRNIYGYYEAVDGPASQDPSIEVVGGNDSTYSSTYESGVAKEVRFYYARKDAAVNVYYYDIETETAINNPITVGGISIDNPTVILGKAGREYTTTPKEIRGYSLENRVDGSPNGIFDGVKNVIYYYRELTYAYQVNYYFDGVKDTDISTEGTAKAGTVINYEEQDRDGYVFDHSNKDSLTISDDESENILDVYYVRGTFDYTVEYYYDNVRDDTKTDTIQATFGDVITTYTDKVKDGYTFSSVTGTPLTITSTPANNIIKVYYTKDTFGYSIHYFYDNVEDATKVENGSATYGDVISTYPAKLIDGYKFDHDTGKPLTITSTPANNVINVYYVKDNFGYTVEYYYDNVKDDTKTVSDTAEFGSVISTYPDKVIDGYKFDHDDGKPLTITSTPANNIIKVYYVKDNFGYTVEYYYDNVKDDTKTVSDTAEFGSVINSYEPKVIDGYKFDHDEGKPLTISSTAANNVIKVYYVKDNFGYTVEYYYDNVKDDSKTETDTAEFGSVINSYEPKVIDGYKFDHDEGKPLTITSTAANNVIKVYYVKDTFTYTTEYYYDGVKDEEMTETSSALFGSVIDGVTLDGKQKDGFTFSSVTGLPLTITSNPANNVIKVYYLRDTFEYTVHYFYDNVEDTQMKETKSAVFESVINTYPTEGKQKDGYKFDHDEGRPLTITSTAANNVINVYYVRDNFGYTVEYYYDNVKDDSKTETDTAEFGSVINSYEPKLIDGYKFDHDVGKPLTITSNPANNVIKVYYVKDNFGYTVEYYYDNVKDDSKTETDTAEFGSVINSYEPKVIDGYKFDHDEGKPLTITSTAANNVIKVYYVKDNFGYTVEYYYDNVKDDSKTETGTAEFGSVINSYEPKVIDGYKFDHDEGKPLTITSTAANNVIKVYYVKDNFGYTVEYYYDNVKDDSKTESLSAEFDSVIDSYPDKVIDGYKFDHDLGNPLTITSTPANNVIEVYYVKDNFGYTVEYYYDNVKDDSKTISDTAEFGSVIDSYPDKVIDGYKFDHDTGAPLTITSTAANNVIKVYYVKDNFGYTVEYYYDNVKDDSKTETGTAEFGSVINSYEDKVKEGFEFSGVTGIPLTITSTAANNVIKVYYVKDTFGYSIHYFYDNVEDASKVESGSAVFQSVISTYPDKVIDGYKFDHDEGKPLTITATVADNVINVYYVKDNFGYTVEYYYDGVKDNSKTESLSAEFDSQVTTYPDKSGDNYRFVRDEGCPLTITSTPANNVIKVYYAKILKITTGVAGHTEHYTDGTTVTGAKGGTISGEGMDPYEVVIKGVTTADELEPVVIIPDAGYDVESVTVNGTPIDFSGMITRGYRVIYPTDLLAGITEDTYIEATFRKISSVKVKYMNKITNEPLFMDGENDYLTITGHEGEHYETENKTFPSYRAVTPAITDIDGNAISGSGEMYADEYTVIYWYEKAEADVIEKHILVDNGTETVLSEETHTGESWTNVTLSRIVDDRYEAADGEASSSEDLIVVAKAQNSVQVQYIPERVREVRFYYNRKDATVLVVFENSLTGEIIQNPVDSEGNPVTNPTVLHGKVGDPYDTSDTVAVLEGYRLDESKLPTNVTGEFKSTVQTVTYKYIKLKEYDIQVVYENDGTPIEDVKIKATSDSGVDIEDYPQGGKLKIDRVESTEEGKIIYTIVETETPEGFKTILDETNPGIVTVERVFNPETNRYEIKTETNGIEGLHVEVDDEAGTVTIYVDAEEIKPEPTPEPEPEPEPIPEPEPVSIKTGDKVYAYIAMMISSIAAIIAGVFTRKKRD